MKKIFFVVLIIISLSAMVYAESVNSAGSKSRMYGKVQGETNLQEYSPIYLTEVNYNGDTVKALLIVNVKNDTMSIDVGSVTLDTDGLAGYSQMEKVKELLTQLLQCDTVIITGQDTSIIIKNFPDTYGVKLLNQDTNVQLMNQDTNTIIKNFPDTYGVKVQDIYDNHCDTVNTIGASVVEIDFLSKYNDIAITADTDCMISTVDAVCDVGFALWEKQTMIIKDAQIIYFKNIDGSTGNIYIHAEKR